MKFSEIIADQTAEAGTIPEGWKQGRATYGGLTAAMLYKSLERILPDSSRPLRWASFSLVGPSDPGPVEMVPRILRQGKNVIQGECHMLQQGEVVATLQAAFGAGRDSAVVIEPAPMPVMKTPEESTLFPFVEGVTPEFIRNFELCLSRGAFPFAGAEVAELGGWMRYADEQGPLDTAALIGMLDAWPPTVLPAMKTPAPVSTLTWTLQFLRDRHERGMNDWWPYLAETDASGDGYAQTRARIWDGDGALVALSQQTIAVFG
jgi:acyl-CoA thioesterase